MKPEERKELCWVLLGLLALVVVFMFVWRAAETVAVANEKKEQFMWDKRLMRKAYHQGVEMGYKASKLGIPMADVLKLYDEDLYKIYGKD